MLPKGIKTSGFPSVEATCRLIGIEFDPWQTDLNRCILGKDKRGMYAADTAVLSIARQVGKTFDIGALVFAMCIASPGLTVVWTAHRFKVSRETFNDLRGLAKRPELAAHIDYDDITTGAGNETIPFRNGSRIVFAARERGAIRGFTKVGILVLDEVQILTEAALADLVPTLNQARNPLIIMMGTPPKPTDPSEVFTRIRAEALAGTSEGVLYVELSSDPGSDPSDRKQWAKANPSYPKRTPAKAILRLQKLLSPEDFDREARGIWDTAGSSSVFPPNAWDSLADVKAEPKVTAVALAGTPTASWGSIAAAGLHGSRFAVGAVDRRPGIDWLVSEAARIQREHGFDVVVDETGPLSHLVQPLQSAGVRLTLVKLGQYLDACAAFAERVAVGDLAHPDHPDLNAAVASATWRPVGDRRAFARKKGSIDMLEAATLALWQASTGPSAYESESKELVTL